MLAVNLTLAILLPFQISFPLSLVVFFLIVFYILKNNSFLADRDIHDMTNKGIIDYNTHFIRVLGHCTLIIKT
jgi:hypothetical protein